MLRPYEGAALLAKLKGRGLDLAEETVKITVEETLNWISESAALSATPFDDIALIVVPKLKELALAATDKIDGQVG